MTGAYTFATVPGGNPAFFDLLTTSDQTSLGGVWRLWISWSSAPPTCYPEGSDCYSELRGVLLAEVYLHEGESLESALKRFKRKVMNEDIIKEIKRHSFYLKPGEKKRAKEALARKRNRKKRSRDGDSEPNRS